VGVLEVTHWLFLMLINVDTFHLVSKTIKPVFEG
jgi:hypothetical protein